MVLAGAGPLPTARWPVQVNHRIRDCARPRRYRRPRSGPGKRVLFLSSPIGLGHAELAAALDGEGWRVRGVAATEETGRDAVAWAREAVDRGAGEVLLTSIDRDGTRAGYDLELVRAVADAVKLPILLYNVPSRTVVDLLPDTVAGLAKVPNIVGIKEASARMERVSALRRLCGQEFILLSGDDATAAAFMLAGGDGVISVTANVVPDRIRRLCDAARQGEVNTARALDKELVELNQVLFVESNPIPVKWALHRMGRIGAGIRQPLMALAEIHQARVEAALEALGVLKA